ncbi:putative histidine kinase HHK5p [Aureobasidium sp. EXF-10728]|nr:putative histidine kinase HHK5p [Aureobasidium sp. EXF-10728]
MRIPIREQLAGLILLAAAIGLAVISIATWYTSHNFILEIRTTRLSLTASLKAAQIASNLALIQNSVQLVSSRIVMQNALKRYNLQGNNTAANWLSAQSDFSAAIAGPASGAVGQALMLQGKIFPRDANGPNGRYSVMNATSENLESILLPYKAPNGSDVYLSDTDYGYPPELYPNLTYFSVPINNSYSESRAVYNGEVLQAPNSTLLLGPYSINTTFSLLSLTMPVINNTSAIDVLGWLTIVCDARLIGSVIGSAEGLGSTGLTLVVGPANTTNHFPKGLLYNSADPGTVDPADVQGRYIWPLPGQYSYRHPGSSGNINPPNFNITNYPAVVTALTQDQDASSNAGGDISTHDEAGKGVSVGFAIPDTSLVDWVVVVEQDKHEVWQPIRHLRKVLLTCIFSVLGGVILFAWPLAHFASAPIRRLREATRRSVLPMGYSESNYSRDSHFMFNNDGDGSNDEQADAVIARKEGFFATVSSWNTRNKQSRKERKEEHRRRQFHIPGKVKERKTCIQDELTDLTRTFNEMSDELMMQYERLEERVKQRTAELELSKKAAEAANESKTLFIANISHELKTPLNGILGMCAVCMQEKDPMKLKRSLGIIYKSGDLLLNLLTDLLTFSKNQVGQQLSLDSKEFRLREISSQVLAIFDKQAKEGQISLRVEFQGAEAMNGIVFPSDEERTQYGPAGTGRVKDMILWGDVHRILQVVINLVSNSLKFTPAGGSVVLTVRCTGEAEMNSRKTSMQSKSSKPLSSRHKNSDASLAGPFGAKNSATANEINPYRERSDAYAHILASERPASPPPGRTLMFEFEVTDTGPGIADHLQQRIFEPFVQGDLGLSKKFGGTGLGLSICSQLATLMKGTIELDSEVGRGSTFTMRIPLRHIVTRSDSTASSVVGNSSDVGLGLEGSRSPQRVSQLISDDAQSHRSGHSHTSTGQSPTVAQAQAPNVQNYSMDAQPRLVGLSQPFFSTNQAMESPGSQAAAMEKITQDVKETGKIRVLVAEDNKVNQEVVLRMLKLEDIYDVTVAKDGQEALDFVKESMTVPGRHPYNLIFMDVQMPNLDGLQSTRLIRDLGYDAPIVALTAFAEESNVKDCLESGMNYFLSKPIRRPALKKVLKEYCPPIIEVDEEVSPMAEKPQPKPMSQPAPQMHESPTRNQSPPPRPMSPAISVHSIGNARNRTTIVNQNSRPNSLDLPGPRMSGEH